MGVLGFIYVLEFGSGVVKVGRTNNLTTRMASYERECRKFGGSIHQRWSSSLLEDCHAAERRLICWCDQRYGKVAGREWYGDADYDDIRGVAETIACRSLAAPRVLVATRLSDGLRKRVPEDPRDMLVRMALEGPAEPREYPIHRLAQDTGLSVRQVRASVESVGYRVTRRQLGPYHWQYVAVPRAEYDAVAQ